MVPVLVIGKPEAKVDIGKTIFIQLAFFMLPAIYHFKFRNLKDLKNVAYKQYRQLNGSCTITKVDRSKTQFYTQNIHTTFKIYI